MRTSPCCLAAIAVVLQAVPVVPAAVIRGQVQTGRAVEERQSPAQVEEAGKLKKGVHEKLGDSHDADYVVDRPSAVPPSGSKGQAVPPGPYSDIAPDDGAPGPAPAGAPSPGMPSTIASLHPSLQYKDKSHLTDDWRVEYGAHGPKGAHGSYFPRKLVGYPVEKDTPFRSGARRTGPTSPG